MTVVWCAECGCAHEGGAPRQPTARRRFIRLATTPLSFLTRALFRIVEALYDWADGPARRAYSEKQ